MFSGHSPDADDAFKFSYLDNRSNIIKHNKKLMIDTFYHNKQCYITR